MKRYVIISLLFFGFSACKDPISNNTQHHNRQQMLEYYVDQQIQPAFDTLWIEGTLLLQQFQESAFPYNEAHLAALKQRWTRVFQAWQKASIFNLGPTGESGLRKSIAQELGTFPISEAKIQHYSLKSDTSFANFDRDSRGLFALEYFFFGGSDAEALNRLNTPSSRNYASAVLHHFCREIERYTLEWKNFRSEFIQNKGTDAGSSTVQLYNAFLMSYENLKNYKLGVPLGLRMGQSQQEPEKVEALYSGLGLSGIHLHLSAITRVWRGIPSLGFKNYLLHSTGGKALVDLTEQQLIVIEDHIAKCPSEPLHTAMVNSPQPFVTLHTELQRNTRFFKSDMSSILGLTITYSSGDGD